MNQIRDLYNKAKLQANQRPQKITRQFCNRLIAVIDKESSKMQDNNDFADIQELLIYRDKFQLISKAYEKRLKKKDLYPYIKTILSGPSLPEQEQQEKQEESNYFVTKKNEIQKSKIGFSLIMGQAPRINKSFYKKPKELQIIKQNADDTQDNEIKELKEEIARLKHKLNSKNQQKLINERAYQQNRSLSNHISAMERQIERIKSQNSLLRNQLHSQHQQSIYKNQRQQNISDNELGIFQPQKIAKYFIKPSQKVGSKPSYDLQIRKKAQVNNNLPIYPQQKVGKLQLKSNLNPIVSKQHYEQYNANKRYQISYLSNDIRKLKEKLQPLQIQRITIKTNPNKRQEQLSNLIKSNESNVSNHEQLVDQDHKAFQKQIKVSNKQKIKQPEGSFLFKTTSNHKFNKSQVFDQAKNIAIRSKISFFKPQMIIYRGKEYQVAVKTIDQQRLLSKRIFIYINNKQLIGKQVKLIFKFNPDYYQVKLIKKASFINPESQSKQEIFVKILNQDSFDNIIEVQLTVNTKTIHFLIPTMFIDFVERRPRNKRASYRKQKVNPIHQFSNIHLAQQYLVSLTKQEDYMLFRGITKDIYTLDGQKANYRQRQYLNGSYLWHIYFQRIFDSNKDPIKNLQMDIDLYNCIREMLFATTITSNHVLSIKAKHPGTLRITNITLSQSSDLANFYLQTSFGSQYESILVVALSKPSLTAYHTEIAFQLLKDGQSRLRSANGSIYLVGQYLPSQENNEISNIADALIIERIMDPQVNKNPSKESQQEKQRRPKRLIKQKKQQTKKPPSKGEKRKSTQQPKGKATKKAKTLLQMMNDLGDDEDDSQQSQYEEQPEPQSSSSSQQDEETPPTKKQCKKAKSQSKESQNKKDISTDDKDSTFQALASSIDTTQFGLLIKYPGLLKVALNLAEKIIQKCLKDYGPIPSSLQQKLKDKNSNLQQNTREQQYWLGQLKLKMVELLFDCFGEEKKQREGHDSRNIRIRQDDKIEKEQFEYKVPTTLPSFLSKK